jgi:hypothetical protein
VLKKCPQCEVEFVAERRCRVYCSFACNGRAKVGNPTGTAGRKKAERVQVACLRCGKQIDATPRAIESGRARYCGQECFHAAQVGVERNRGYKERPPEEKLCQACGRTFMVGGRGNAKRTARLCSIECQRAARRRRPDRLCRELSPTAAAYIAGFIDGEGSIMLITRRRYEGAHLRVSACNTHRGVLDWIEEVTGIGRIYEVDRSESVVARDCYHWRCHGSEAKALLAQLREHLIIKRPQADMGIEFQERLKTPALLFDKTWQMEWMAKMKLLNKRGRPDATAATYVATFPSGG